MKKLNNTNIKRKSGLYLNTSPRSAYFREFDSWEETVGFNTAFLKLPKTDSRTMLHATLWTGSRITDFSTELPSTDFNLTPLSN